MTTSSGFILPVLVTLVCILVHDCDGGQLCASCSNVDRPSDCQHHVTCRDDEQCYNRRYINASGTALYDLGCIASHACPVHTPAFVGRRASGPHFKCLSCCNGTLCNQMADCDHTPLPDNQPVCASCSRTTRPHNCVQNETCSQNEDCYLHKYSTGSGSLYYDLGCISADFCRSAPDLIQVPGKRSDDNHLRCLVCCNNGGMCNKNLKCSDAKPHLQANSLPRDCGELNAISHRNGSYTIYPTGIPNGSVSVYCEFDRDGSWTVIQRRFNGSVNFYRNWTEYKNGFGNSHGEYWIGNDIIHQLTIHDTYTLKIVLTDWNNATGYAEYSIFKVADETDGYRLTIVGYSGTAGDSMAFHNGTMFSTMDRDNDNSNTTDCVKSCGGGAWWHGECCYASLNSIYSQQFSFFCYGIRWYTFHHDKQSFRSTKMMIRRQ